MRVYQTLQFCFFFAFCLLRNSKPEMPLDALRPIIRQWEKDITKAKSLLSRLDKMAEEEAKRKMCSLKEFSKSNAGSNKSKFSPTKKLKGDKGNY